MQAGEIIRLLALEPHPKEGGFFREIYRSEGSFAPGGAFTGLRSHSTAIYYLLTPQTCSSMHRLPGDELFHFYLGDPVEMLQLHPDGRGDLVTLGPDPRTMELVHVVGGGIWQGARLREGGRWALLGTTMSPGFDYADYEAGTTELLEQYPGFRERIASLL